MSSIKEALEPCPFCGGPAGCVAFEFVTCLNAEPLGEESCLGKQIKAPVDSDDPTYSTAWNTRATLQPSSERREAIARVLAEKWPGDYMQGDDECEREPNALAYETADLILASGLVQENKK